MSVITFYQLNMQYFVLLFMPLTTYILFWCYITLFVPFLPLSLHHLNIDPLVPKITTRNIPPAAP